MQREWAAWGILLEVNTPRMKEGKTCWCGFDELDVYIERPEDRARHYAFLEHKLVANDEFKVCPYCAEYTRDEMCERHENNPDEMNDLWATENRIYCELLHHEKEFTRLDPQERNSDERDFAERMREDEEEFEERRKNL